MTCQYKLMENYLNPLSSDDMNQGSVILSESCHFRLFVMDRMQFLSVTHQVTLGLRLSGFVNIFFYVH